MACRKRSEYLSLPDQCSGHQHVPGTAEDPFAAFDGVDGGDAGDAAV